MAITHQFVSAKTDGVDASVVQPSDWNASHNYPPQVYPFITFDTALNNFTTSGATATYGFQRLDLTHADQVRFCVTTITAAVAGSVVRIQYSSDNSTWNEFSANLADVNLPISSSASAQRTLFIPVPAEAKGDVLLRMWLVSGSGTTSVQLRNLHMQYK